MKTTLKLGLALIVGALIAVLYIQKCSGVKVAEDQGINLMNALYDSIKILRINDSISRASISVIETARAEDFLRLKTRDSEVEQLQAIVEEYRGKLKEGNSATIALLETINKGIQPTIVTKIDTVYAQADSSGTIHVSYWPTYLDTVSNEWLKYSSKINKDSAIRDITIYNKFSAVIGQDKQGPFADITVYNPYSSVKVLRTYQVAQPRYKSFGVGLSTGITYWEGWKPYIGVGINYIPKWLRF